MLERRQGGGVKFLSSLFSTWKVELFETASERHRFLILLLRNMWERRRNIVLERKTKVSAPKFFTQVKRNVFQRWHRVENRKQVAFSSRLREWNKKSMEYYGGDYFPYPKMSGRNPAPSNLWTSFISLAWKVELVLQRWHNWLTLVNSLHHQLKQVQIVIGSYV